MNPKSLEIARRLSELGELDKAREAYILAISENDHNSPILDLEAAMFLLLTKSELKIAYTLLVYLHKAGHYRNEIMQAMIENCYAAALTGIAKQYRKNQNAIAQYKYTFCDENEFVQMDDLRLRFFPVDDKGGYMPYDMRAGEFLEYVNINNEIISRNFFGNLDNAILAENVYSQYELEYLYDNVRKSEWCGKENHIYLYYSDFEEFCGWAQVLDFSKLLADKKIVFLLGEAQKQLYPIDFKATYGIDYEATPPRELGISEIKRIIWHTQLSSHNGGDFFNEIFDNHPNIIAQHSIMLKTLEESYEKYLEKWKKLGSKTLRKPISKAEAIATDDMGLVLARLLPDIQRENGRVTKRDIFVGSYIAAALIQGNLDISARISPAIFFQPHFGNIAFKMHYNEKSKRTSLDSNVDEEIEKFGLLSTFKYIKAFTPIRRITTSNAASVKFSINNALNNPAKKELALGGNLLCDRILNQSYYRDPENRYYKDSIMVRFEDGKLNPKATFTRLAAFLDLPYTDTMTYCSNGKELNPEMLAGNDRGFDPAAIYRKYDEYTDEQERYVIEYLNQPVMKAYGYENHYYDGRELSLEELYGMIRREKGSDIACKPQLIDLALSGNMFELTPSDVENHIIAETLYVKIRGRNDEATCAAATVLLQSNEFINAAGRPLELTPIIVPDPDLLETELYK